MMRSPCLLFSLFCVLSVLACSGSTDPDPPVASLGELFVGIGELLPAPLGVGHWDETETPCPSTLLTVSIADSLCPPLRLELLATGFVDPESLQTVDSSPGIVIEGTRSGTGCPGGVIHTTYPLPAFGRLETGTHSVDVELPDEMVLLTIEATGSLLTMSSSIPRIRTGDPVHRLRENSMRFACSDTSGYCLELMADILAEHPLEEFTLDPAPGLDPWGFVEHARYFTYPSLPHLGQAAGAMEFKWFHEAFGDSIDIEIRTWKNQVWTFHGAD